MTVKPNIYIIIVKAKNAKAGEMEVETSIGVVMPRKRSKIA